jgi:hypothetical protein
MNAICQLRSNYILVVQLNEIKSSLQKIKNIKNPIGREPKCNLIAELKSQPFIVRIQKLHMIMLAGLIDYATGNVNAATSFVSLTATA